MILAEQRRIALGATKAQLRKLGIDPKLATVETAEQTLDELARVSPDLIASKWFISASNYQ